MNLWFDFIDQQKVCADTIKYHFLKLIRYCPRKSEIQEIKKKKRELRERERTFVWTLTTIVYISSFVSSLLKVARFVILFFFFLLFHPVHIRRVSRLLNKQHNPSKDPSIKVFKALLQQHSFHLINVIYWTVNQNNTHFTCVQYRTGQKWFDKQVYRRPSQKVHGQPSPIIMHNE